jgi:hypothetical protein
LKKKWEEEEVALAIFFLKCRKRHPLKECPLDQIEICGICEEEHSTSKCPSLPWFKRKSIRKQVGRPINYVSSHKNDHGSPNLKVCLQTNLSISILIGLMPPCNILPNNGTHLIPSTHNGCLCHPKTILGHIGVEKPTFWGPQQSLPQQPTTPQPPPQLKNLTNLLLDCNSLHNLSLTPITNQHNKHMLLDFHFTLLTLSLPWNVKIYT